MPGSRAGGVPGTTLWAKRSNPTLTLPPTIGVTWAFTSRPLAGGSASSSREDLPRGRSELAPKIRDPQPLCRGITVRDPNDVGPELVHVAGEEGIGGLVRSTNWSTALSPQPTVRCTSVQRCVVLLAGTFSLLPSAAGGLSRLLIPRSQVRSLPGPCRHALPERGLSFARQVSVARQAADRISTVSGSSPSPVGLSVGPPGAPAGSSAASRNALERSYLWMRHMLPRLRIKAPTGSSPRVDRYSTSPSGNRRRRIGVVRIPALYSAASYGELSSGGAMPARPVVRCADSASGYSRWPRTTSVPDGFETTSESSMSERMISSPRPRVASICGSRHSPVSATRI
jgi:hypothetical protein